MIAASTVKITPERSLPLAGFAGRHASYQRVHDGLEANVVLVDFVAIVQIDVLFCSEVLEERIQQHLGTRLDLLLVASHTHFAPSLDPTKPVLGICDDDFLEEVAQKIGTMILALRRVPSSVRMGVGAAYGMSVNRRSSRFYIRGKFPFVFRGIVMQPNAAGPADPAIHTFTVEHNGSPLAILWHYTCHPTGFPDMNAVSADFVGAVRQQIRDHFRNPLLPVLFLPGFSGDVSPNIRDPAPALKQRIKYPGGNIFGNFTHETYTCWCNALAEKVLQALDGGNCLAELITYKKASINVNSILPAENGRIKLARLSFGSDVHLIFIGAEVVQEYLGLINIMSAGKTLGVGYTGHVFGYLPTNKQVIEGGYEAEDFLSFFSLRSKFPKNTEEIVVSALKEIGE